MLSRRLPPAALLIPITLACHNAEARARTDVDDADAVSVVVRPAAAITRAATIAASGSIEARATADIAFQVAGRVMAVGVDEGDRVRAGTLVAYLDPTDYALAFEQAKLAYARAADEARRARVLRSTDGIAPNDFDKLINAEAQAEVSAAMANKRLHDTRLVSPLSGVVARRNADAGETVPAGAPVFTIVDLDVVHVRVAVPESDVGAITTGTPASITVPSLGDSAFTGKVRLVGVAADPVARTFAVEIAVPNPGHRLKAGMVAEASITTPASVERLTVPGAAIVRDAEGATQLFIYAGNEKRVHTRRVTVGTIVGTEVEITNGLEPGELVVVGGQQRLREGMAARPANEPIVISARGDAPGSR